MQSLKILRRKKVRYFFELYTGVLQLISNFLLRFQFQTKKLINFVATFLSRVKTSANSRTWS